MARIYVASSWRNETQQYAVACLRLSGHEVYDFRNPSELFPSNPSEGFSWEELSPRWNIWSMQEFVAALDLTKAREGFRADFDAMRWADTFLLLYPCGRSAHLEAGWACGQGKKVITLLSEKFEPELMLKMCDHICTSIFEVLDILSEDS